MKKYNKVVLYSLSTCFWCAKTRKLLKGLNIEFQEIYVDLLNEKEQEQIMLHLKAKDTFPILRVDDKNFIGYNQEAVKKLFE